MKIVVSADGPGIVSGAGALLLTEAVRVTGLGAGLSTGLARWRRPPAVHNPGKVIADLAVAVPLSGDCWPILPWCGRSRAFLARRHPTRWYPGWWRGWPGCPSCAAGDPLGAVGGPGTVKIAIETERGLLVASLRAAGYEIYPVNPEAVDRYRDRHHLARGKSDAADAMVLAHILRTDARLHRPLPADSPAARAIDVLARAHQDLVWSRQHEVNRLRSLLGLYYRAALAAFGDLTTGTAMTVLAAAPTPAQAARLDFEDLLGLLSAAGRGRRRSEAERLAEVFTAAQMRQPPQVEAAMGDAAAAIITTITAMNTALTSLQARGHQASRSSDCL